MIIANASAVQGVPARSVDGHDVRVPKRFSTARSWFFISSAVTALALVALAGFLEHEGLDRADKWSSVVFGAAGAVAVAAGALFRLWRLGESHDEGYEVALSRLADAQRELWTAEQAARRVRDPWPLNVRWLSSVRAQAAMASWASVRGAPGVGAVDLDGGYDQVAGLLDRGDVPRRLVVLGDPGAGKSMLVLHLTLEVLGRRAAGEPVPVLLTAAGWNPVQALDDERLDRIDGDAWTLRQLAFHLGNTFYADAVGNLTAGPDA